MTGEDVLASLACGVCAAVLDYCLNEWFNATCDRLPGHVVLMTSARFGRMSSGRCISGEFNVGCVKDVLRQLDGACSGRTSCFVAVRSLVELHPCQKDFVSYLEASYECVEGRRRFPNIYFNFNFNFNDLDLHAPKS